tara:strand:- start:78 stop:407 length:330 start_codon:yes stop_codon:yes gene_type:complete
VLSPEHDLRATDGMPTLRWQKCWLRVVWMAGQVHRREAHRHSDEKWTCRAMAVVPVASRSKCTSSFVMAMPSAGTLGTHAPDTEPTTWLVASSASDCAHGLEDVRKKYA